MRGYYIAVLSVVIICISAFCVQAQHLMPKLVYPETGSSFTKTNIDNHFLYNIPFTHELIGSDKYRQSAYGKLFKLPSGDDVLIGDERVFFVRNVLNPSQWYTITAKLFYLSDKAAIWINLDDVENYYDAEIFEQIRIRLHQSTLLESIQKEKGILEILENYFGTPPDIDGTGLVHILFLDIPDNFESTGGYVAGFFDPVNLFDHEYSNRMALVYIDLYPTLYHENNVHIDRTTATVAHEL